MMYICNIKYCAIKNGRVEQLLGRLTIPLTDIQLDEKHANS